MHKDYNDLDIVTVFKYETSLYVCIYIYSILKCYFKRYYRVIRVNVQHFDFHLNPFFLYESFNLMWIGVHTLTDCVLHMDNTIYILKKQTQIDLWN